jgi:hypothetical protein
MRDSLCGFCKQVLTSMVVLESVGRGAESYDARPSGQRRSVCNEARSACSSSRSRRTE